MKTAKKSICAILTLVMLLSGCASAQKDEIFHAEEGDPVQIAETISLEGLSIDSVEYACAWFRNMAGELSEPISSNEGEFYWYMFSDDLSVSIWPDENVPECVHQIGIFNNQDSLPEEDAQQFKNLCLTAIAQFMNDDVASRIAAFFEVGPVTEGAHPYEGNDDIFIYYYPEENQYFLRYYSNIDVGAFETTIEMDTGFVQYVLFIPSALTSTVPATDALEPLPTEDEDGFSVGTPVCTYDEKGNLIRVEFDYDINGIGEWKTVEDYKYDENGNLTYYARIPYKPDGSMLDNETYEIFCQMYGSENRIIKEYQTYDTSEYTVEYTYNPQGILTNAFYYGTGLDFSYESTTKYEYNDQGLLIKSHSLEVDTNGTSEFTKEYEYNSQDLLIKAYSTQVRSNGDFYEYTTEYEYNDQGTPISVYTLVTAYTPFRVDTEDRYNYIYNETGKCLMVEYVYNFNGQECSREQFQCDNRGYIYDDYGEQLYPLSLPSADYPDLPQINYY